MQLIEDIVQIYQNYGFTTEVLVASVRHPMHILQAAKIGADIVTFPLKVLQQICKHPLTDKGLEQFLNDWKKTNPVA
jgi:transaldolase